MASQQIDHTPGSVIDANSETPSRTYYLPHLSPTSINDMPLEILAEILILNSTFDMLTPRAHFRAVVASSQVCSLWRKTSLAYPKIWARCMDLGLCDEWVAEIMSRSKGQPLDFVIPSITAALEDRTTPNYPLVYENIYAFLYYANHSACQKQHYLTSNLQAKSLAFERCGRLFLSLHAGDWEGYNYRRVIKEYFPEMTTIAITACRHTSRNGRLITFERLLEAQELPAYLSWKVEILKLHHYLLPLNIPVFKSIRELKVVGRRKGALKQEDWFTALRNMPQLRILILRYAIAAFTSPVHLPPSRRVHIPLLSRLEVTDNVATTRVLMSNISYPIHKCEATISVDITAVGPIFEDLCVILADKYRECAQDVAHITISSLSTRCSVWFFLRESPLRKHKLCVRLNRPEAVGPLSEQAVPPRYKWPGSKDPLIVLLDAFKEHCGMAEVLTLNEMKLPNFPGSQIFHLFTNTRKLRLFQLTGHSLQALRPLVVASGDGNDDAADTDHAANLCLLPLLQNITYLKVKIPEKSWRVTRPGINMFKVASYPRT